jgi:hypothetical protein
MKIIITESQYKMLLEEQKVLHIPSMKIFDDDWNLLQKFLERKGYPPYTIGGNLNLEGADIKSLGNLQSVGGNVELSYSEIQSLGKLQSVGGNLNLYETEIQSLGNLQSVGGSLGLNSTEIESLENLRSVNSYLDLRHSNIESFGNLQSVGGDLYLLLTPIAEEYSKEEIRQMVQVGGNILM